MSEILWQTWWVVGLLLLLKISVLSALYHSRRTIRLLRKKSEETREVYDRLSTALRNLREEHGNLVRKQQMLVRHVKAVAHAVVEVPLPNDLLAVYGGGSLYLPRICHKEPGVVEVMIPGVYIYAYTIHIDLEVQTNEERERIYEALRRSKEARAELGIAIA